MKPVKDTEPHKGRQVEGELSERLLLGGLGLLAFAYFLWLNRVGFSLGYFLEDNQWLFRSQKDSFLAMLAPVPGVFYRPLTTNLPYFLFGRAAGGLLLWKILAALVLLCGYYFLWRWLKELSQNSRLGLFLATLWLFHPSLPYGLLYPNAFDYVLFPALFILFLYALQKRMLGLSIALVLANCLSKEMALAFPLFFLLHRTKKNISWKLIFCSALIPVVVLAVHGGFSGGRAGGFQLQFHLPEIIQNFRYLGMKIFFGPPPREWFFLAWLLWTVGLAFVWMRSGWREALGSQALLIAVAAFFLPLLFLSDILTSDLGPIFWILIFGAAAGTLRRFPAIPIFFLVPAICIAGWIGSGNHQIRMRYSEKNQITEAMIDRARERLKSCGTFDNIVVSGFEDIFGNTRDAELSLWALIKEFPTARFYLLRAPSAPALVSRFYPLMWVSAAQAEGHPQVKYFFDAERGVQLSEPSPACGGAGRERVNFVAGDRGVGQ